MAPPEVGQRLVVGLLERELPRADGRRLVLVHGRYAPGAATEFVVTAGDRSWPVRVSDQHSVLGVVDAWHAHRDLDGVLVVTTGVEDPGWDVRAHAVRRSTLTVDRADIVASRFGATDLDPRIRREPWLLDALIDAEPAAGWRRHGPRLTRDTAVRALLAARLGLGGATDADAEIDAGALLDWSRTHTGPARYAQLDPAERNGLREWLDQAVGGVAAVVTGLAVAGRAADAMALGVLASVLDQSSPPAEAVLALGGLLGGTRHDPAQLRSFVTAVDGALQRRMARAESGGPAGEEARREVLSVVDRADALADDAGLTPHLDTHPFLPSAFRARHRALAATLTIPADGAAADVALRALQEHQIARLHPERTAVATMAVRLLRRLATRPTTAASVSSAVTDHLHDGAWAERALSAVWAGESSPDPQVARAYRAVHDATRARLDSDDETFGGLLTSWTAHAAAPSPGGALLVEQVLDEIATPLLAAGPPLIIVVDGMSGAVATELGAQVAERGWAEVSRAGGRRSAAVAAVPSVTRASRSALLTGRAVAGDQAGEAAGFAAFWKRHRRAGTLFHKAGIAGAAGHRLAEPLIAALAGDGVVGVVLNTVDDALDHGREGDRTAWRLEDITHLPELLDAARGYGRPVVLVSDHGHVLERSPDRDGPARIGPHRVEGVESARWRTGADPGPGEVVLAGPRVLLGGGRVVVPWRHDLRYTRRRAGYHGGASCAEMTVPVLVLLPVAEQADDLLGWSLLGPENIEPDWWSGRRAPASFTRAPATPAPRRTPRKPRPGPEGDGLFEVPAPTAPSLGARVVASPVYDAQRAFVPRAPAKPTVAAVLDSLVAADGRLSAVAVAAALGRAGRDPEFVVAALQRLLNVEGFPVLSIDAGRSVRLDVDLLILQFEITRAEVTP